MAFYKDDKVIATEHIKSCRGLILSKKGTKGTVSKVDFRGKYVSVVFDNKPLVKQDVLPGQVKLCKEDSDVNTTD